jgi:hypothetical protein
MQSMIANFALATFMVGRPSRPFRRLLGIDVAFAHGGHRFLRPRKRSKAGRRHPVVVPAWSPSTL